MPRGNQSLFRALDREFIKDIWQSLRETIDIQPRQDPLEPVMSVSDDVLSIRNASHTGRNAYLLPLALAFVIGSSQWLYNICYKNAIGTEITVKNYIEHMETYRGSDYFKRTDNPDSIYIYKLIDRNGKMSFSNYISYRLSERDGLLGLLTELFITLLLSGMALFFSIKTIRLSLTAEIFFDRKQQIIYSWANGRVYGCHFKNLGYAETSMGLALFFYGEFPTVNEYNPLRMIFQPTGKALFNGPSDNTYFMGLLLKFMEEGKSAIIEGDNFRRKPQFYFFKDKKPENFELRLEKVLEKDRQANG